MTRAPRAPLVPTAPPSAELRVEPTGSPKDSPRGYMITLELEVRASVLESQAHAHEVAAGALSGVASPSVAIDSVSVRDVNARHVDGQPDVVTGVSAMVLCGGWPTSTVMSRIRAELMENGYRVSVTERRACAEPGCSADATVVPGQRDGRAREWFSASVCGRHDYRSCTVCSSVLRMRSSSADGQAPAVSCPVCQSLLVEWGGSKVYDVELVERRA